MQRWADVATLTNTKGTNGKLVVRCAAGFPFVFESGMEVALVPPVIDAPRRVTVSAASEDGLDGGSVQFDQVKDASTAEMIIGCHCLVHAEIADEARALSFSDELEDISGWDVIDEVFGLLGTVADIQETPAQLLLVIDRANGGELLVPLVDEFISRIDEEGETLILAIPQGLLEL